MNAPRATAGFSLVEVLLIVAIIGLLLGVALPNQLRAAKQADTHHCRANLEDLQSALRQWSAANSSENPDATVTMEMLQKYLARKSLRCPSGGQYTLTPAGQPPTCSRKGHALHSH